MNLYIGNLGAVDRPPEILAWLESLTEVLGNRRDFVRSDLEECRKSDDIVMVGPTTIAPRGKPPSVQPGLWGPCDIFQSGYHPGPRVEILF
jgi:hypothetical protein